MKYVLHALEGTLISLTKNCKVISKRQMPLLDDCTTRVKSKSFDLSSMSKHSGKYLNCEHKKERRYTISLSKPYPLFDTNHEYPHPHRIEWNMFLY